jgi:3-phosphoshikimate 1-carboxyvinyltransferase
MSRNATEAAVERPDEERRRAAPPLHTTRPRPLCARAPADPLAGRLRVPGDKSISHRALMFGAIAVGTTAIEGLLEGEDVLRTAAAMRALGAEVERLGEGRWRVSGRGIGGLVEPEDVLDMGNSGTAARLLCGLLAGHPLFAVMTGDASLRRRPMRRVIEPLSATGARFAAREGGRLPLAVEGAADPLPLDYRLPVASAQVKSACLLAGLCAPGVTRVVEPEPTRDHSENMLRHFGATVRVEDTPEGRVIELAGQPELTAAAVRVPGDPSSAAFAVVAALLVPGSRVVVENVGLNPLRTGLFTTLREMGAALRVEGARVEGGEPVGELVVEHAPLRAVEVPPGRAPSMIDEFPILAVAAACASGVTRMRGLAELRVKESDRLAATAALLAANGVRAEIEGDDLLVHGAGGPPLGGGTVATRMDHRIAMSALVLGLAARAPVTVDDAAFIDTSFPGFAGLMNRLAAGGERCGPEEDGPIAPP